MPTNHKPVFDGSDKAMVSRIHLIPFSYVVPPDRRDKELYSKLIDEAPGILAWAVEGCLAWQDKGLNPPGKVKSTAWIKKTPP